MKSIYLLSFILVIASAKLGVDLSMYGLRPSSFFTCLASNNVTLNILEILSGTNVINQNFLQMYSSSKEAKISDFDAIATLTGFLTPEDVCNKVANALPGDFNGTLWLRVDDTYPYHWVIDIEERMPYLEQVVKSCSSHGLKLGVYSSNDLWTLIMGSREAGSDILSAVPVWYTNENNYEDFNDFEDARFGTWTKPQMKKFNKMSILCGSRVWSQNYYE